jgi:membrane protein
VKTSLPAPPGNRILAWLDNERPGQSPLTAVPRRLLRVAAITLREFHRNDLSLRASALTLTILLSLVPILAMSAAVIKGLGGDNHLRQLANDSLAILEQQAIPLVPDAGPAPTETTLFDHLRAAVETIFDYVDRTNFAALGGIGTLAFIFSILLVLHQIEGAMNTIWHVAAGRSFLRKLSDYITLLVLMPLAVNIGFAASAFIERPELLTRLDAYVPVLWLQGQLLKMIPVIVITFTLWIIYLFFPNTRVRTLPALAGALVAAVCWFAAQSLFVSMQIGVSRYNAIYGSFASLPLFLLWLHFVWLVVLAGAQLACTIQNSPSLRLTRPPAQPSRQLDAGFAIMIEVQRAFENQQVLTFTELERLLAGHDRDTVRTVGNDLARAGLLHISASDGRLLPAGPAATFRPSDLVSVIIGAIPTDDSPPRQ